MPGQLREPEVANLIVNMRLIARCRQADFPTAQQSDRRWRLSEVAPRGSWKSQAQFCFGKRRDADVTEIAGGGSLENPSIGPSMVRNLANDVSFHEFSDVVPRGREVPIVIDGLSRTSPDACRAYKASRDPFRA